MDDEEFLPDIIGRVYGCLREPVVMNLDFFLYEDFARDAKQLFEGLVGQFANVKMRRFDDGVRFDVESPDLGDLGSLHVQMVRAHKIRLWIIPPGYEAVGDNLDKVEYTEHDPATPIIDPLIGQEPDWLGIHTWLKSETSKLRQRNKARLDQHDMLFKPVLDLLLRPERPSRENQPLVKQPKVNPTGRAHGLTPTKIRKVAKWRQDHINRYNAVPPRTGRDGIRAEHKVDPSTIEKYAPELWKNWTDKNYVWDDKLLIDEDDI